jgi:hypothetical protein
VQRSRIDKKHWPLLQALLLQTALAEPGTTAQVLGIFISAKRGGLAPDLDILAPALQRMLLRLLPLGQANEAAWALWGTLVFDLPPDSEVLKHIEATEDSVVALIALHARAEVAAWSHVSPATWQPLMVADELWRDKWLLVYEALAQGWLKPARGNPLRTQKPFRALNDAGVRFFDKRMFSARRLRPTKVAPNTGLAPLFSLP